MHASQVLKAPMFATRLLFKLRKQSGGREVLQVLRDTLGMSNDRATAVGKKLKMLASPLLAWKRTRTRAVPTRVPDSLAVDGWVKLQDEGVSGANELVQHCTRVFERREAEILSNYTPPFSLIFDVGSSIARPEEIEPVVRFCAQRPIFDLATSYLGEYPALGNISFGYTAPDSGRVGSQLFHCDSNEPRQLHMILPIWPIDMESGPFTFLPAPSSARLRKEIKHDRGRIPDDVVFSHVSEDELIYCTGEPGDVYFVNPYACFHCGARTRSKPRLILIVNFTSLFQGVEPSNGMYSAANRKELDDGRQETRFLLNL